MRMLANYIRDFHGELSQYFLSLSLSLQIVDDPV